MNLSDRENLDRLKMAISHRLKTEHAAVPADISTWKKKEIELLQDSLLKTVNGRISEKWFYTHIKGTHTALPRIDMLDMLSQYSGYDNWPAFLEAGKEQKRKSTTLPFSSKYLVILTAMVFVVASSVYLYVRKTRTYCFCLVSTYSGAPVRDQAVDILLLNADDDTETLQRVNRNGCVFLESNRPRLGFTVRSPYYAADSTWLKPVLPGDTTMIQVKPNDYEMIIRLFSRGNVQEWNNRKKDLQEMFHDNAKIYQVYGNNNNALSIFNKDEFISKLLLPTGSLKHLEVLETKYQDDKIKLLRFKTDKQ